MKYIAFIFSLFIVLTAKGQSINKLEKRIYLVDVTASMSGKGVVETPDIFNKVKDGLEKAIESINDLNTEIAIIPFTNTPHSGIRETIRNKEILLEYIRDLSVKPGDTNIADAWSQGVQEIDSTRINYIFLLTDGLHNCGPTEDVLYERLMNWEALANNKYYFAFYVMLTPNARKQKICDIVEQTNQMWLIESMNVYVTFINFSMNIQANVRSHKALKLPFTASNMDSLKNDIDFNIRLDDNPYYKISNFKINYNNTGGYVLFDIIELKPIIEIPLEVRLGLHVTYDRTKYPMTFFTPEDLKFKIINSGLREMTIKVK